MEVFIGILFSAILATAMWHRFRQEKMSSKLMYGCVILFAYTVVLFLMHAVRIGDYNYWGDEAYSIMLSRMSYLEMFQETASDVHPPLYYILLKIVCAVIGNNPLAYNLTSLIPYGIFLILSVTVIGRKFGYECSAIMVTCAGFLDNAITYNVEVRMYSWGLLFVFLSYCLLYRILHGQNTWNYVWFTVSALCAAYTHYFCLVMVAFFYLTLLVMAAIHPKKYLKPVLWSCVITVAAYLPWLVVFLKTLMRVSGSFWIPNIPTIMGCVAYLFETKYPYSYLFSAVLAVVTVINFNKELSIIRVETNDSGKRVLRIHLKDMIISMEIIWVLSGFMGIFGTAVFGMIFSKLTRPLFMLRYLYPAVAIAWLLLGAGVSKLKYKKVIALLLIVLLIAFGFPIYRDTVTTEAQNMQLLERTVQLTAGEMSEDDQIFTTERHISWTISRYYYPDVSCSYINADAFPEMEEGKTYWLITKVSETETVMQQLAEQSIAVEEVVTEGNLGTWHVNIYKITE